MPQSTAYTLITSVDTVHGIHFTFGNNCTYSHLIKVLDVLRQERADAYLADQGQIWLMVFRRED